MKTHSVKELDTMMNPAFALRKISDDVVDHYATLMSDGVVFPPVTIGHYRDGKGVAHSEIVDGYHRIKAARQTSLDVLPVTEITYGTQADFLGDMLKRNIETGYAVSHTDRNIRIFLLKGEPFKMTEREIAKSVGLTQASVNRILNAKQGGGRREKKIKTGTETIVYTPGRFFRAVETSLHTLAAAPSRKAFLTVCAGKKYAKKVVLLAKFRDALTTIIDGLAKSSRR